MNVSWSRLLRPFDQVFQWLVPVVRNRVCYISAPDYTDNAFYVYRHLLCARDDLEHIWLVRDSRIAERICGQFRSFSQQFGRTGNRLKVVRKHTLLGYWLYATSRWIFHTHGGFTFSRAGPRREVVNLWHGMPIKCIGALNHVTPNPVRTFGTMHVATSHMFRYIIACAFEVSPDRVLVSGLPRCDALTGHAAGNTPKAEIARRLGLPEDRKLLMWLPTYRSEGAHDPSRIRSFLDDLPRWFLPSLASRCRALGCEIIIKLHPKDPLNQTEMRLEEPGVTLLQSSDWLDQGIQLYDLIAASDALVSDVSSVLIDYLVTGRPIGVVGFDSNTYTRDLVFPIDYLFSSVRFHHLGNEESLASFVNQMRHAGDTREPRGDSSSFLYAEFSNGGAEAIVNAVGL